MKRPARPIFIALTALLRVITGAVVSTTVTFWLQAALLPQASVTTHSRMASKVLPQWVAGLVTVLTMVIVLVPPVSVAVGASNVQGVPISIALFVLLQVSTGAVVSTTVTFWLRKGVGRVAW